MSDLLGAILTIIACALTFWLVTTGCRLIVDIINWIPQAGW